MIEAKAARELADNITSKAALKQIEKINELIQEAAAAGLFKIDITREDTSPCVDHYLTYLKYKIKTVVDDNKYILKKQISW